MGISAIPNVADAMLAESDLKNLGMHTELDSDARYRFCRAGKLTDRRKTLRSSKGVTDLVFGSGELYDWFRENTCVAVELLEYVNAPEAIGKLDSRISINSCTSIDLYGQICAETVDLRKISGTVGQLYYLAGAAMSRRGKAFIYITSLFSRSSSVNLPANGIG